jgi:hypothetical protein
VNKRQTERRVAADRRTFPPRPEGRRMGDGRRDGEAEEVAELAALTLVSLPK